MTKLEVQQKTEPEEEKVEAESETVEKKEISENTDEIKAEKPAESPYEPVCMGKKCNSMLKTQKVGRILRNIICCFTLKHEC